MHSWILMTIGCRIKQRSSLRYSNSTLNTRLVAARCASIRLDGSYREKNRPGKSGWVLEDLFKANFIRTSAAMVKQECFKNIGLFDEELCECEEYDLWLRIAAQYPMGFINKSLAVYVDNPDGVSTDSLTGRLYRLRVLEKKYLQDKIPANLYARRIADTCHYIGRHYIKRGEKERGGAVSFESAEAQTCTS